MRGNRRRIGHIEPRHHPEQPKRDQGQREGQDHAHQQRHQQRGVDPMIGHAGPALKADGKQQVNRHALGDGFGDREVGFGESRQKPQRKEQDYRRKQVIRRKRQYPIHPLTPVGCFTAFSLAAIQPPVKLSRARNGALRRQMSQDPSRPDQSKARAASGGLHQPPRPQKDSSSGFRG